MSRGILLSEARGDGTQDGVSWEPQKYEKGQREVGVWPTLLPRRGQNRAPMFAQHNWPNNR